MADFKRVHFGPNKTHTFEDAHGYLHYQLDQALKTFPTRFTERLVYHAQTNPEHVFLSQNQANGGIQNLTYGDALDQVERIAQSLLDIAIGQDEGIAILSENSIEHALLALAALHVGIPYAPISPPYSLFSTDYEKLRHCLSVINPKVIFAQDGLVYQKAIEQVKKWFPNATIVCVTQTPEIHFHELVAKKLTYQVQEKHEGISGETVAKILFTSGSTGVPKGVINTHGMWCASLQQITQALAFMEDIPPVFVDWLPWNHTFGGNQNFGLTVFHGGSLHIDEGRPISKDMDKTISTLRTISPTAYFNVPKGFEMLVHSLEKDADLRTKFFANLQILFFAGASMAQPIWDALERMAIETIGEKIPIITGLGCTEAGPSAMFANWGGAFSGLLGVPVAGLDIKLVPNGDKLEARYKGPNISPGYWKNPTATGAALDEEGYFCSGDAVKFLDPTDTDRGMVFDGRIAEDFKLNTGTWVSVGVLKSKVINLGAPLIQDVVLTGINEAFVGAIFFLNEEACRHVEPRISDRVELFESQAIAQVLDEKLAQINASSTGSSTFIKKYVVATKPPSIDLGEITDKGSLNQRVILSQRAHLVDKIYTHAM